MLLTTNEKQSRDTRKMDIFQKLFSLKVFAKKKHLWKISSLSLAEKILNIIYQIINSQTL